MTKKASKVKDDGALELQLLPEDMKKKKKKGKGSGTKNSATLNGDEPEVHKRKQKLTTTKPGNGAESGDDDTVPVEEDHDIQLSMVDKKGAMGIETRVNSRSKTLFVGNIPYSTRADQIVDLFAKFGHKCVDCMVPYYDGCSRGFAYAEFSSAEDAEKAMHLLNKKELMGQPVTIEFAFEDVCTRRQLYMSGNWGMRRSLIVKGIDESIEENKVKDSLKKHFSECEVLTIRVLEPQDSQSGKLKNAGKAILDFKDNFSFAKALELDKSKLDGQILAVTEAKLAPRGPHFVCSHCGGVGVTCAKCGGPIGGRLQTAANTKSKVTTVVVKFFSTQYSQEETQNYLHHHFSSYGPVARVVVPLVPGSKVVKSTAFIHFKDEESAKKALVQRRFHLDGQNMV